MGRVEQAIFSLRDRLAQLRGVEEEIAEAQRPDFRMVLTIDANCFPRQFAG